MTTARRCRSLPATPLATPPATPLATVARLIRCASPLLMAAAVLLASGAALAATDPSVDSVYQAAHAGRVEDAQQMLQSVLRDHPNSGKAHFVHAELLAAQGQAGNAREELATAERLAPGLPFATTDAVDHLRRRLDAGSAGAATRTSASPHADGSVGRDDTRRDTVRDTTRGHTGSPSSSLPWGILAAIIGGALLAWLFMRMSRSAAAPTTSGNRGYGLAPAPVAAAMGPTATVGAGAAPAGGLGSQVVGGLATGLAAGAGVMVAESIAHRLFAPEPPRWDRPERGAATADDARPPEPDLGGNDFGVGDASTWDDASNDGGGWDS